MELEPIQDYLAANTTLVSGQDLFIYHKPHEVEPAVQLVLDDSGNRVDSEITGRYIQRFQVIVSDPDYTRGKNRAAEIFDLLRSEVTQDWTGYCTSYIRPMSLPINYRRSAGDVVEWSINFETLLFIP